MVYSARSNEHICRVENEVIISPLLITGGVPKHLYCCVTRQSSTRQGVFQSVLHEHIFVVVKEASPLVCFRVFQMLRLQNTAMGTDTGEAMAELWNEGKVGKLILINMMNMLIVMTMMMSKVIVMVMKMKIIRGSGSWANSFSYGVSPDLN